MDRPSFAPTDADLEPEDEATESSDARRTLGIVVAGIVALLLLVGLVAAIVVLVRNPDTAEALRDVVIVLIGAQTVITGVAVIVLLVQMARLTALLQNEVRPMLEATNETLNTLRGTSEFLSDRVVRPVVRANGAMAALRRALELVGLARLR
ncbi:MAG TPA: hypothetical protein VLL77_00600 [Anaerolineales bacterium]|nr:hypothetical protein [Anaerolineales bacterium]